MNIKNLPRIQNELALENIELNQNGKIYINFNRTPENIVKVAAVITKPSQFFLSRWIWGRNYVPIYISDQANTEVKRVYIQVNELCKQTGIARKMIQRSAKVDPWAPTHIIELYNKKFFIKEGLNHQLSNSEMNKLLGKDKYVRSLNQIHKLLYAGDPKLQRTLELAGKVILRQDLENYYSAPPLQTNPNSSLNYYGFTIDKKEDIYIDSIHLLEKGHVKEATAVLRVRDLSSYAKLSVNSYQYIQQLENLQGPLNPVQKGEALQKIDNTLREEEKILKKLKKVSHIIPSYKVMAKTGKNLNQNWVMIQSIKEGNASFLKGDPRTNHILCVMTDAANGLAGMHKKGLIHADFRPAHVLLENSNQMIRGSVTGFTACTKKGKYKGHMDRYAPPEILNAPASKRGKFVTDKMDSFALGVSLVELVNRRPAFERILNQNLGQLDQQNLLIFIERVKQEGLGLELSSQEIIKQQHLLDIAKELLHPNSKQRLSCLEAAKRLQNLLES